MASTLERWAFFAGKISKILSVLFLCVLYLPYLCTFPYLIFTFLRHFLIVLFLIFLLASNAFEAISTAFPHPPSPAAAFPFTHMIRIHILLILIYLCSARACVMGDMTRAVHAERTLTQTDHTFSHHTGIDSFLSCFDFSLYLPYLVFPYMRIYK